MYHVIASFVTPSEGCASPNGDVHHIHYNSFYINIMSTVLISKSGFLMITIYNSCHINIIANLYYTMYIKRI